jgi:hypothetical protein
MAASCKEEAATASMVMFYNRCHGAPGKTFSCCVTVSIHSAKQRIGWFEIQRSAGAALRPAPKQSQPQAQALKPAQIDRNGVLILIRQTLLALDQANKTGNYTVLRDLGSPDFQANTAAGLAEI